MENLKSIQQEITEKFVSGLVNKIEELFIEGLKRKGFEFNTKNEFESFIKNRCSCIDYSDKKEKVYFVDNSPFFLHNYNTEFSLPIEENRSFKMSANYGSYSFL